VVAVPILDIFLAGTLAFMTINYIKRILLQIPTGVCVTFRVNTY
jgi:hypothetical protein